MAFNDCFFPLLLGFLTFELVIKPLIIWVDSGVNISERLAAIFWENELTTHIETDDIEETDIITLPSLKLRCN